MITKALIASRTGDGAPYRHHARRGSCHAVLNVKSNDVGYGLGSFNDLLLNKV